MRPAWVLLPLALTVACPPPEDSRAPEPPPGSTTPGTVPSHEAVAAMEGSMDRVMRCYASDPTHGWVRLALHIAPDGHIAKFADAGSTVSDEVLACIQGALAGATFPTCRACGGYIYSFAFHLDAADAGAQPGEVNIDVGTPDGGQTPQPTGPDEKWM
jgi:hypothetical protein